MKNSKFLILSLIVWVLVGCQRTETFTVNGTVANAAGEMLYLEHTALTQTSVVDSCKLDEDGIFVLEAPAPAYPDFYRLRIGTQSLPLAVDSTENISISVFIDCKGNILSI